MINKDTKPGTKVIWNSKETLGGLFEFNGVYEVKSIYDWFVHVKLPNGAISGGWYLHRFDYLNPPIEITSIEERESDKTVLVTFSMSHEEYKMFAEIGLKKVILDYAKSVITENN